ncbi:MAG: hypothetical protein QF524_05465, partial [Planctomycetota bacterium]|nr:hypothetical protein [Planctomycetota bacterium]
RSLEDIPDKELCSILLTWIEDRFDNSDLRLQAYPLLRQRSIPAILPRLLLRLKYEKDLRANVEIAATLLELGNGAGLEALQNILMNSKASEAIRAQALEAFSKSPYFKNAQSFEESWDSLSNAVNDWGRSRTFGTTSPTELAPDLQAEIWRMIAKLESQPLRPVDDARFVLSRMRCELSIPPLLEAMRDSSLYVREHALQTLAWMGYTVGEWDLRTQSGFVQTLAPFMDLPRMRPRVLDALASSGSSEAADIAVEWLKKGNYQTATAAADCLLRCASSSKHFQAALELIGSDSLSPEANWSLHLLLSEPNDLILFAPTDPAKDSIPQGERERRKQWALQRKFRPGLGD